MDFSFTDEQKAVAELAAKILSDHGAGDRLKKIEASRDGYEAEVWAAFAEAGLLGAALPEDCGGSGGGFVDACLLLEQQGRRVVSIPLVPTVVCGAMPIARFGSKAQKERWLPAVVAGKTILAAALSEQGSDQRSPATKATAAGAGFRLDGTKMAVPFARSAAALLVPARLPGGGTGVFLVERDAPGLSMKGQESTNWEPDALVHLDGVAVGADALLGEKGREGEVLPWILDRATTAVCAIATGACQEAMRITAEYASNRKQFDKPIAMFQAVGQRMAECFIDNEAVGLTMWQAAALLDEGLPAEKQVAVAKYWASEGGNFIAHAGLHIHGGISIDVDYPIHRYFLWLKQAEFALGAATPQLVRLGSLIAAEA